MLLESYRIFAVIVKFSLYPLQADIIAPTHNLIIMNKNRHRSCTLSARLDFGQFCAYHLSCPVHDIRVWRSIVSVLSLPFAISWKWHHDITISFFWQIFFSWGWGWRRSGKWVPCADHTYCGWPWLAGPTDELAVRPSSWCMKIKTRHKALAFWIVSRISRDMLMY